MGKSYPWCLWVLGVATKLTEYTKTQQRKYLAMGRCRCGRPQDVPGRVTCSMCLAKKKKYWNGLYKEDYNRRRRELNRIRKQEVIRTYGGKCACCGEDRWEFLTIDHVNGGGTKHRKQVGSGGGAFYKWLKANGYPQEGYRVLCMNCNMALGLYGYCPHQVEKLATKEKL